MLIVLGGETGKADTCNAMQSIANDLIFLHSASWATYRACTKDSDCNEIACTGVELDSSLKLTTLPCYSPPAIQLEIVYKGATYLDHTFAETEEVFVTIEGVISIIRVILYHPDKSSIFLQVSTLAISVQSVITPTELLGQASKYSYLHSYANQSIFSIDVCSYFQASLAVLL